MESTGKVLQNRRKEKGLQLEDISRLTKIHSSILISIENGELSKLGGAGYAKVLITNYARALDFSESEIQELLNYTPIKKNVPHKQPDEILRPQTILFHKNIFFIIALVILTIAMFFTVIRLYNKKGMSPMIEFEGTIEERLQELDEVEPDSTESSEKASDENVEVIVDEEDVKLAENEAAPKREKSNFLDDKKDYLGDYFGIKAEITVEQDLFHRYVTRS